MLFFEVTSEVIIPQILVEKLLDPSCGGTACFSGHVRNHNQGHQVRSLEYQCYRDMALKEGKKIMEKARQLFEFSKACAIHREGHLQIGEIAVWVGVASFHRDAAFKACRYIIDHIKTDIPIWKKEHYIKGPSEWVFCKHHHANQ